MPKVSAGVLLFRRRENGLEVLLAHPGGPLWAHRDDGAWSIPKGEADDAGGRVPGPAPDGEDAGLLALARRELAEETGHEAPPPDVAPPIPLGPVRQAGGKLVHAWAIEDDLDPELARSNTFEMEWPPRSGRTATFPEVDRVAWFGPDEARRRLNAAQAAFVDRLLAALED